MPNLEALFAAVRDSSELRLEHSPLNSPLTTNYSRVCQLPQNKQWIQENDLRIGHLHPLENNATTLNSLTDKTPAAIGYLLSKRDEAIPVELTKRAKQLDICLFSIPPDLTAATLQNIALKLVLDQDNLAAISNYAQLSQQLLETLNSHKPERVLLEKLQTFTGGSFLLLSSDNKTLASAGPLRIPKTRLLTFEEGSYQLQIRDELHQTFLFRIKSDSNSSIYSIFVALIPNQAHLGLIENAAFLLSLSQAKQVTILQQQNIQREAFLSEWFANSFDNLSFKHQLNTMGFDESASYTVAVVKLVITLSLPRQEVTKLLEALQLIAMQFFDNISLTALSSIRPKYQMLIDDVGYNPHCIFVFSGANPAAQLEPLYQVLESIQPTADISTKQAKQYHIKLGFSQESYDYSAESLKTLYQQAQQAALQAQDAPQQFQRPEALQWLLSEQSPDKLQALLDSILKPLQEADKSGKLFDTLVAFLEEATGLEPLAAHLNIHLNTLRYRLKKIEKLTGKSLTHPKHLAEFYLLAEIIKLNESRAS